jgi:hypothetical protein
MIEALVLKEFRETLIKNPKMSTAELALKYGRTEGAIRRYIFSAGFKTTSVGALKYFYPDPLEDVVDIKDDLPHNWDERRKVKELVQRGYSKASICLHLNIEYRIVDEVMQTIASDESFENNQHKGVCQELGDPVPLSCNKQLAIAQVAEDASDIAPLKMRTVYDYKSCECIAALIFKKMMEISNVAYFDSKIFQDGMDNVNVPVTNSFLRDVDEIGNVPSTGDVEFDRQLLKFAASQLIGFNLYKFLYDRTREDRDRLRPKLANKSRKIAEGNSSGS